MNKGFTQKDFGLWDEDEYELSILKDGVKAQDMADQILNNQEIIENIKKLTKKHATCDYSTWSKIKKILKTTHHSKCSGGKN